MSKHSIRFLLVHTDVTSLILLAKWYKNIVMHTNKNDAHNMSHRLVKYKYVINSKDIELKKKEKKKKGAPQS